MEHIFWARTHGLAGLMWGWWARPVEAGLVAHRAGLGCQGSRRVGLGSRWCVRSGSRVISHAGPLVFNKTTMCLYGLRAGRGFYPQIQLQNELGVTITWKSRMFSTLDCS